MVSEDATILAAIEAWIEGKHLHPLSVRDRTNLQTDIKRLLDLGHPAAVVAVVAARMVANGTPLIELEERCIREQHETPPRLTWEEMRVLLDAAAYDEWDRAAVGAMSLFARRTLQIILELRHEGASFTHLKTLIQARYAGLDDPPLPSISDQADLDQT